MFKDLPELYRVWGELSETGSHATINALCERFVIVESGKHVSYRVNYTGIDERTWIPTLFTLLLNFSSIEQVIYDDFKSRLQFDEKLTKSRQTSEILREQLRQEIIARYDIKMPQEILKP